MKTVDTIRLPFFYVAVILIICAVLIEIGSGFLLKNVIKVDKDNPASSAATKIRGAIQSASGGSELVGDLGDSMEKVSDGDLNQVAGADKPPGMGIPYMANVDGVLLFTLILVVLGLWLPKQPVARVQGCVTCLVSLMSIPGIIALIFLALGACLLMVGLLLAVPFGTIAYFAIYGFFDTGTASAVLSLLMSLKIGFVICLVVAQPRFLQNISLVVLTICSFICNIVLSFLHGFVPGFLVSITDAIGAILIGICGVIWVIILLIGAIPAIIAALNLKGASVK